jgi:hypothetical protein
MKCAYHPKVETNLRCGKCGKPICPKCMVQTPVGARCRDCAGLDKLPTFRVSSRHYLIAAGTALGMAIACGAAWGLIEWLMPVFSLSLLLAPAAGYAIGEVTSRAVNRKRGTWLAVVGGIAAAVSYAVTLFFPGALHIGIFGIFFGIFYHIIAVGLGIFIAVTRLR